MNFGDVSDLVNGGLEFIGSLFLMMNVVQLYKDKAVRGVKITPTIFFTLWGSYSLYYYLNLNQLLSFVGAICLTLANAIWVWAAIYYTIKEKKENARRK